MIACLAALLLVALAACDRETETQLMGRWQLREVRSAGGTVERVDTVWYNFQTSLFMYQLYDASAGPAGSYYSCYGFNHVEEEGRLLLELLPDPKPLAEFLPRTDWAAAQRLFVIEKLSSGELILSGDGKEYRFRKF